MRIDRALLLLVLVGAASTAAAQANHADHPGPRRRDADARNRYLAGEDRHGKLKGLVTATDTGAPIRRAQVHVEPRHRHQDCDDRCRGPL